MKCGVCHKNKAIIDPYYGYLPCNTCRQKQSKIKKAVELTTEEIKEERRANLTDILPFHRKGELDRGAIDRYGKDAVRKRGFSESEINHARYVWNERYYKE